MTGGEAVSQLQLGALCAAAAAACAAAHVKWRPSGWRFVAAAAALWVLSTTLDGSAGTAAAVVAAVPLACGVLERCIVLMNGAAGRTAVVLREGGDTSAYWAAEAAAALDLGGACARLERKLRERAALGELEAAEILEGGRAEVATLVVEAAVAAWAEAAGKRP